MNNDSSLYHPEQYWSEVAERTSSRTDGIIAGDDEPFYRYKRAKFLTMLQKVDFENKSVLEIGPGPGGNLNEIWKHKPKQLMGADISQKMVDYANKNTPDEVEIVKINGTDLPFEEDQFDISITVTVLQHNTDEQMLHQLMASICRCTSKEVILYERIEQSIKGNHLNMGRPVEYYSAIMSQHGYILSDVTFLNIPISYFMAGITRKLMNSPNRKEAEPLSRISLVAQSALLPITQKLDPLFDSKREFAQLKYHKASNPR